MSRRRRSRTYLRFVPSLRESSSSSETFLLTARDAGRELGAELTLELGMDAWRDCALRDTVLLLSNARRRRSCIFRYFAIERNNGDGYRQANTVNYEAGAFACDSRKVEADDLRWYGLCQRKQEVTGWISIPFIGFCAEIGWTAGMTKAFWRAGYSVGWVKCLCGDCDT